MASPHDLAQRRLTIEPTQEVSVGRNDLGERRQFEVPQIKQK